jgi:hypothetical protein
MFGRLLGDKITFMNKSLYGLLIFTGFVTVYISFTQLCRLLRKNWKSYILVMFRDNPDLILAYIPPIDIH